MFELKLEKYTKKIKLDIPESQSFKKPIIFYLVNKEDIRSFFITFVIVDFIQRELIFLFSYNKNNLDILNKQSRNERFSMEKSPHMTISIHDGEDFLTFIDEEQYLFYVNYKKMIMRVYTGEDLIEKKDIIFKRISSTVYKDNKNPNFFFMSITDSSNLVHVFRASLTLDHFEEIDSFPGHEIPPHVIRNYKDYLLMSHVFKYPTYLLEETGKVVDQEVLASIILKNAIKIVMKSGQEHEKWDLRYVTLSQEQKKELLTLLKEKYMVKCLPGKILLLNSKSKEKILYSTSGGTPAHFEIDTRNDTVYTSSHNFIIIQGAMIFYEPAVIDKFKLADGHLELVGSFSIPEGYRYTSHRIFYYKDKAYICTIGQPNRLMFIDATEMQLLFSHDIEEDELTEELDVYSYVNSRDDKFEVVALEVSKDGENILIIGPQYIYLYNFPQRKLYIKIDYKSSECGSNCLEDYIIRTLHTNYIE